MISNITTLVFLCHHLSAKHQWTKKWWIKCFHPSTSSCGILYKTYNFILDYVPQLYKEVIIFSVQRFLHCRTRGCLMDLLLIEPYFKQPTITPVDLKGKIQDHWVGYSPPFLLTYRLHWKEIINKCISLGSAIPFNSFYIQVYFFPGFLSNMKKEYPALILIALNSIYYILSISHI